MSLISYTELCELVEQGVITAKPEQINGSSIDLTLHNIIRVEDKEVFPFGDPIDLFSKQNITTLELTIPDNCGYALSPDEFILASSNEFFNLPDNISCEYKLKSSMARNGLEHLNAGWCLVAGTKIPLLNGTEVNIEDLVGQTPWVYSLDEDGEVVPGQVSKVWETKKVTETIEITLDNDATFECTPEHKIMLRDGSYLQAKDLQVNQAVMPLYRKFGQYDHEFVYCPSTVLKSNWANLKGKWNKTHVLVDRAINGALPSGYDVHHDDHNKENNEPTNLKRILSAEHIAHHNSIRNKTVEQKEHASKAMMQTNILAWKDPEYRAKMAKSSSKLMTETNKKLWADEKHREKMLSIQKENAKYLLNIDKQMVQNKSKLGFLKKTVNLILEAGESVCEETYTKFKRQNAPRVETFIATFGSFNNALELVGYLNHKVAKITKKVYAEAIPVYDMTVPEYHNFALSAGVFVHNCDAGWNNSRLTLELKNVTRYHKLLLKPGMPIGQVVFFKHEPVPSDKSYAVKGQYNNQSEVTASKGIR